MNAFGEKLDSWEKFLSEESADCSKEKIEISRLKDEITALNDALKEKCATLRTSMFSRKKLPTLANVQQTNWLRPDYVSEVNRLKQENQDLVLENNKLLQLFHGRTKGGSRRIRNHKRSAARRRGTASRRRYKNRK